MLENEFICQKNIRKIEPVFCADDDWYANACINWSHDPISLYAIGYKEAADKLVEYVLEKERNQDSLVYPLLFLYRQYIELRLKEIIREGRILQEEGNSFPQHHKIKELWTTAKSLSKKAFKHEDEPFDYSYTEHVIYEFAKIDPNSFAFRYPESKDGTKLLEGITHINLRRVATHINELANDLELISLGISVYREWQQDMWSSI